MPGQPMTRPSRLLTALWLGLALWLAAACPALAEDLGAAPAPPEPYLPPSAQAPEAPAPSGPACPVIEEGVCRQPPLTTGFMGAKGKKTVWLPIPMIGTSPNKGVDMGILPVWLFFNEQETVRYILAPSVDYNTEQGLILTARLFSYPAPCRKWFAIAEKSLEVRQNYEAFYEDFALDEGRYYLRAWAWFQDDPTSVFYGFGPYSQDKDESRYNQHEAYGEVFFGLNVGFWRFLVSERERFMLVQDRGFDQPDFTGQAFPHVPGLQGSFNAFHGLAVVYDDRDQPDIPTCGRFLQLWGEASLKPLSDDNFFRYGAEWRQFIPWPTDRFITAYQLLYTAVTNRNIPFYEQPALGGEDFRGFPESRFVGKGKWQVNLEERIRVVRMRMFDVDFDVEVAPFLGVGQVFEEEGQIVSKVQPIAGVGFRAVVKPQVVGKVDVGYGREGMNIFVSLNYPF